LKLRYAVKIAAIKAAYTQLGVTTQPSASVTAGIFQVQRLGASIQTLNRIVASVKEGNFMLFAALFDTFYIRDGAGASDAAVFNFFKTLTDDVDGAASILDDQEMQFVKQHTDVVGFSDLIQFGFVYSRQHTDVVGFSDLIQFGFVYPRQLNDTGVSLDSFAFSAAKALADGHTVSDVINVLTGKHFSDTFSASETLAKAVSAARIDSALLGDAHAAASSKVLSDTPLLADAGSLRSQGYCDFAYFAEDYVGASRTFT
jgi:hypothetical protein